MRFVAVKEEDQADIQALHRIREQADGRLEDTPDQSDAAFCLEYGVPLR